jgi:phage terminase Nu1 subunit (DNA packaging protein)
MSSVLPDGVIPLRPRSGREPWVSATGVARHFQVSVRTIQRWRRAGCPSLGRGGLVRFRLSAVEAWLSEER